LQGIGRLPVRIDRAQVISFSEQMVDHSHLLWSRPPRGHQEAVR
jgi:hypothetical protein